jgi:hypothetical protein
MNYNDLKKDELIELLKEKDDEIKDYVHLANAVEAKDKELSKLKNARAEEIAAVKQNKDKIIEDLRNSNQELTERLSKMPKVEDIKLVYDENVKYAQLVRQYKIYLNNFLMNIKGAVDNAIELEALLGESTSTKEKGVNK